MMGSYRGLGAVVAQAAVAFVLGLAFSSLVPLTRSAECQTPWDAQVDADLIPFQSGITLQQLEKAEGLVSEALRVRILNNTLWWTAIAKDEEHFRRFNETIYNAHHASLLLLTKALCAHSIPNVEFILELGDRTASTLYSEPLPIFVGAKDVFADYYITYPYWNMLWLKQALRPCRSNNTDLCPKWEDRKPQLFWRGSPTGGHTTVANYQQLPRSRLVASCMRHPDLCDAGFTNFNNVNPDVQEAFNRTFGTRPKLPMDHWGRFKYMILVDGVTAPTSRSVNIASLGAVMLKQESPIREFWYSSLVPWKHYIPVTYHATDVITKLRWAQHHPHHAKKMAEELWRYADTSFTDENVACYWSRLLRRYAALQQFKPAAPGARWNQFRIHNHHVRNHLKASTSFPCEGP